MNLQKKQCELLGTLNYRYLCYFPSEFCLNSVSIDRYQILRFLSSREVVGYKEEKPIPKPSILKEGELLRK